ncbi:MAG: glycoside hydrolase family 2 TIM barrel-domain containing protein, partial [Planctomycetia bacterium]|nr:glycoside hydrolase family 2 TIM barrel-domain containing protein [Planctomycetia bacterium]
MKIRRTSLFFLFLAILTISVVSERLSVPLSAADWGAKSSPAVVNPVVKSEFQEILTLAGEWDFKMGSVPNRIRVGDGIWGNTGWDMSGARKIQVPGLWETQGVGEPGPGRTWDCIWDCGQWILRHQYIGNACYQREIEIPATWENKRVFLKVGGLRTEAFFWVNGQRAAYVNNYCATEKFEITPFLKVGEKNTFSIFMRNDTPSRKGLLSVNHHFGGFYRDLELEAVPETFIDDVWVASDFQNLSAVVNIQLAGAMENTDVAKNTKKTVKIEIQTRDGKTVVQRLLEKEVSGITTFKTIIPIPNCQVWSPENPFLYHAVVTLLDENGKPTHGWCERFGIRELKVVGKQFYLNGKPYFLRGAGDHNYDSISIMEPACRERFLEHMKTYKAAGFNATRHHTHCPLPEYFEAADEMGLLLQPELPYYHDVPTEGFLFDPMRDMEELYRHYRRYVSFAIYSGGNEGHLGSPLAEEMYQWVKKNDPARIIQHQDGGKCTSENSDFTTGGILTIKPWASGTLEQFNMPVVAHEYLNLAIKMDPALEPRFNGVRVMPPMLENQAKLLEKCELDAKWGRLCVAASERLQAIYQKQGLEAARLDPACDGYFFWSLVDAGAMNGDIPASQGYLNVFWEPRPNGWKPEEFSWFNGPTVLLVKPDRNTPIAMTGEKIVCDVHLSHFGAETLSAGPLTWRFGNASGTVNVGEIPPGFVGSVAEIEISVPSVKKPEITKLCVMLGKVQNAWKWRIFPEMGENSVTQNENS